MSWHDSLADFAFAMQGLGTGSISLFGSDEIKAKYLPPVRDGRHFAAFALSEPEAGSDVSALATTATKDGPAHVRIDGMKTWISNGGIADHYVVFARTGEAPGAKGLSGFVVDADTPGLEIAGRIEVIAPHPLATLRFTGCRVPLTNRLGGPGEGFKVAMATLDIFRSTVAAAALGLARRAFDEMTERAATRNLFGAPLADLQLTQAAIADSAIDIDAAALLVYRAAWEKDRGTPRITRESSTAKAFSTEMAQRVIDRAVQVFGGNGVRVGVKVEALYREIRALRIYEGATEVQKLIIAREVLKAREDIAHGKRPSRNNAADRRTGTSSGHRARIRAALVGAPFGRMGQPGGVSARGAARAGQSRLHGHDGSDGMGRRRHRLRRLCAGAGGNSRRRRSGLDDRERP